MKKKGGAGRGIAALLLLLAVCMFAVFASGMRISFIDNYTYNFKKNIMALARHFEIELSEPVQEFLQDLSTPEPVPVATPEPEVSPAPEIEDAEDIPEVEFDERQLEDKDTKSTPVALENASAAKYARYRGYILCVNSTSVIAFDSDGRNLWALGIHMSDPILSVNGSYYMIAERGGRKVALFDGRKQLFVAEADGNIKSASLSANGDIAVVSEKEFYKGAVIVINKNGDRVFSWNSGTDNVIDADIAAGSRKLAVSLLSTEDGAVSRVQVFDIAKGESTAEQTFAGSVVYDVDFLGEVLNVFADDKVCGMSQRGKILWESAYTERKLLHYRAEDSGYKLLMVDNNNASELEILTGRGRQKSVIAAENMPDCMDLCSGMLAYNSGRDLVFSTVSGRQKKTTACPREIRDIYIIDNDHVMVVYNSGLDFIKFI